MVNLELINEKIEKSGMKLNAIADKLGISRYGLYNKLKGATEFKASELVKLVDMLDFTEDEKCKIF